MAARRPRGAALSTLAPPCALAVLLFVAAAYIRAPDDTPRGSALTSLFSGVRGGATPAHRTQGGFRPTATDKKDDQRAAVGELRITVENDYGKSAGSAYGWGPIVEPHRITTLRVSGLKGMSSSSQMDWRIDGSLAHGRLSSIGTPRNTIDVTFTDIGAHTIYLAVELAGGEQLEATLDVMCKYVRREIRSLSVADRNAFFSAFETLGSVPTNVGQRRFGPKYQEKDYFISKHMEGSALRECDHWHEGLAFMGIHMALTLEFEQALQSVDPTVAVPYWDFTIESAVGGDWRSNSVVFQPDWFGEAAPSGDSHEIQDGGRWENWPVRQDAWNYSVVHNSYGLLRAPWNNNNALTLTRSREMFGHAYDDLPSGCSDYSECLDYDNWFDLANCLGSNAHGRIHNLLGGGWGSGFDDFVSSDLLANTPWSTDVDTFLIFGNDAWYRLWRWEFLDCPEYCSLDVASEDCQCACNADKLAEGGSAYDILRDVGAVGKLYRFDTTGFVTKDGEDYTLAGLDKDEVAAVWQGYLDAACSPGTLGDHFEAGSPNDVSFWPLHTTMERLWHWSRLSADDFDDTWVDVSTCEGNDPGDKQVFKNLVDSDDAYYTNDDIYQMLEPTNELLPYVYDDFEWPHCDALGVNMANDGRRGGR